MMMMMMMMVMSLPRCAARKRAKRGARDEWFQKRVVVNAQLSVFEEGSVHQDVVEKKLV
jgi:hypothetical protein